MFKNFEIAISFHWLLSVGASSGPPRTRCQDEFICARNLWRIKIKKKDQEYRGSVSTLDHDAGVTVVKGDIKGRKEVQKEHSSEKV